MTDHENETDLTPAVRDAVAVVEEARHERAGLPSPTEWQATMKIASTIAATEFVPKSYRGRPEAVVAAMLMGREIGIGPMEALRQITMIDGRPTLSSSLMLAKMRENGVVILESSADETRAWIKARRSDTGEVAEVSWTMEEADKITRNGKRLSDGDNWRNYPADMLWARAVGRLARRLGSDLLAGNLYSTEEMGDLDAVASEDAYFDPGATLLPGAIQGQDAGRRIMEALNAYDPSIDWAATIQGAIQAAFGVSSRSEIPDARRVEFWIRLSNAVAKIDETCQPGTMPPPSDDVIAAAFAWAFGVDHVEIVVAAQVAEVVAALDDEARARAEADDPVETVAEVVEEAEAIAAAEEDAAAADAVADGMIPLDDVPFGDQEEGSP